MLLRGLGAARWIGRAAGAAVAVVAGTGVTLAAGENNGGRELTAEEKNAQHILEQGGIRAVARAFTDTPVLTSTLGKDGVYKDLKYRRSPEVHEWLASERGGDFGLDSGDSGDQFSPGVRARCAVRWAGAVRYCVLAVV